MSDQITYHVMNVDTRTRTFQVYGTVCGLPTTAWWRGTVSRTADGFVWHLYEH